MNVCRQTETGRLLVLQWTRDLLVLIERESERPSVIDRRDRCPPAVHWGAPGVVLHKWKGGASRLPGHWLVLGIAPLTPVQAKEQISASILALLYWFFFLIADICHAVLNLCICPLSLFLFDLLLLFDFIQWGLCETPEDLWTNRGQSSSHPGLQLRQKCPVVASFPPVCRRECKNQAS